MNNGFVFGIRNERSRNESVDFATFPNFVFVGQDHVLVAAFVGRGREQTLADSVKTFDAPEVADLIKSLVTDDITPKLVQQIFYLRLNGRVAFQLFQLADGLVKFLQQKLGGNLCGVSGKSGRYFRKFSFASLMFI